MAARPAANVGRRPPNASEDAIFPMDRGTVDDRPPRFHTDIGLNRPIRPRGKREGRCRSLDRAALNSLRSARPGMLRNTPLRRWARWRALFLAPGPARILNPPSGLGLGDPALAEFRADVGFPLGMPVGARDLAVERGAVLIVGGHESVHLRA